MHPKSTVAMHGIKKIFPNSDSSLNNLQEEIKIETVVVQPHDNQPSFQEESTQQN